MIYCTLDGKVGYPDSSSKIKITYANQYVTDSGSYTYEISFPMAIMVNRALFGNVQRFDVKKQISDFEECRLYVDNRLIISGKGTVTGITNETVKVQIVGGKSRIKYNSKFEDHYIDEITYPDVVLDSGIQSGFYTDYRLNNIIKHNTSTDNKNFGDMIFINLSKDSFVGQKGVCALNPIYDETNNIIANSINVTPFDKCVVNGINHKGTWAHMYNIAVQPNLMYVLKKVLEYEGYTITENDFDIDPWNRLLVATATKTTKIEHALPHWTVYYFLDEIRKLFNASIIFDEIEKTVSILSTNELFNNKSIEQEVADDFTVEHDDDGLQNLATSNIEYAFDTSTNHEWREVISNDVQKKFTLKKYDSKDLLLTAAKSMSAKDRRTTLFQVGNDYYIFAVMSNNDDPDSDNTSEQLIQCGYFSPIIRDIDSDDYVDLNICPAAFIRMYKHYQTEPKWITALDLMGSDTKVYVPSVSNDKESGYEDMTEDENGDYYVSVQDAMENGVDTDEGTENEGNDTKMPVMFQSPHVVTDLKGLQNVDIPQAKYGTDCYPVTYSDSRINAWSKLDSGSLSLSQLPYSLGLLEKEYNVDKNNEIEFQFVTEKIPDPAYIYTFHNKRYICAKIEMEVTEKGIDPLKTGYFYELID
jgi:hypothetical protein